MPSITEMQANVRLRCDEPRAQKPSVRRTLQAVIDATQNLYNRLENTGQPWSLKPEYTLTVANGTQDYLLALDASYGKPIQVLSLYPGNPSYMPRLIESREFAEMYFDWGLPANIASWMWNDGSNCTAVRVAFYYKDDGSRWVRVLPQPQLTAQYSVIFASGNWADNASLDASPVLSQFHSLVEVWASQSLLPSCEWWDDQKLNVEHRKELAMALVNDQVRFEQEFDRYCRTIHDDRMTVRDSSFSDGDTCSGLWY